VSKDIEVTICDAENICDDVRVKQGFVPDDHVPMALVRAVNAACAQLGIDPPGELFAQASSAETAMLRASLGELTEQSAMITQALADTGFPGRVSTGSMLTAIADMRHQALVGRALGPEFAPVLKEARRAFDAVNTGEPVREPQVVLLLDAARALGSLLAQLRRIDPEPVGNGDGSTTATVTEAVKIGTTATAPGVAR
jgi:hypothetical protein